jgi:hypothetical protein
MVHMPFFFTKISKLPLIYMLIPKMPLFKKKIKKQEGKKKRKKRGEVTRPFGVGCATPLAKWGWSS